MRFNALERGLAVFGFTDDFERGDGFDDLLQALTKDRMIVGDDDADFIFHTVAPPLILTVIVVPAPGAD